MSKLEAGRVCFRSIATLKVMRAELDGWRQRRRRHAAEPHEFVYTNANLIFLPVTLQFHLITLLSQTNKVYSCLQHDLENGAVLTSVDESVVLSRFVIHRYAVTDDPRNGYSSKLKQKLWQKCRGNGQRTVACTLFNWLGSNVRLMAIVPQQNNLLTERLQ